MENLNQQSVILQKKRVYEVAKELQTTSKRLIQKLSEIDISVYNHFSLLTIKEIDRLMRHISVPENDNHTNTQTLIAPKTKTFTHIASNQKESNNERPIKRVYELAKELNTTSKRLMEKLNEIDINVASYTSALTEEEITRLFNHIGIIKKTEEVSKIAPRTQSPNNPTNFVHFHSQISKTRPTIDPNVSHRVQMVYNAIESKEKEYGNFKKCEFHLHTPASYDYSLHTKYIPPNAVDKNGNVTHNGEYSKQSLENVIDLFSSYNIYEKQVMDHIRENIEKYKSIEYEEEFIKTHAPFKYLKEELAYLLIAHQLFENGIQMVLITDHNTIDGYKKLKTAIKKYYELKKDKPKHYVAILLGVEITCSEKNHVVGIFENNQYEKVKRFLEEDLDISKDGTYYPSIFVIEKIFKLGGVAHNPISA